MKYAIITFFFCMVACKKQEDQSLNGIYGFRPATCNDTSDDGKHESFNAKEYESFIHYNSFIDSASPDLSAVTNVSITSRNVGAPGSAYLNFTCSKKVQLNLWLPITRQAMHGFERVYQPGAVSVDLSEIRQSAFPSDCSRIFYVFTEEIPGSKNQVVSKGHFDVSIL